MAELQRTIWQVVDPCLILKMTLALRVILNGNLSATTSSQIDEHLASKLYWTRVYPDQLYPDESYMYFCMDLTPLFSVWKHDFGRDSIQYTRSSSQCTGSIRHLVPCPRGNWNQGWFVDPPKKSHVCSHHNYFGNGWEEKKQHLLIRDHGSVYRIVSPKHR